MIKSTQPSQDNTSDVSTFRNRGGFVYYITKAQSAI